MDLLNKVAEFSGVSDYLSDIQTKKRTLVAGLSGSAKTLVMASAFYELSDKLLIIAPTMFHVGTIAEDLSNLIGQDNVFTYTVNEVLAAEMAVASPEAVAERIATLDFLTSDRTGIVVASIAAMRKFIPASEVWKQAHIEFEVGLEIEFDTINENLVRLGYKKEQKVGTVGEYALRGSILDIYPLNSEHPIRIEFFGDEVDSIRIFDVDTQRTISNLEKMTLSPAVENVVESWEYKNAADRLSNAIENKVATLPDASDKAAFSAKFESLLTSWRGGLPHDDGVIYLDYLYEKKWTLFDYIEKSSHIIVDDYSRMLELNHQILTDEASWQVMKLEEGKSFGNQQYGADFVTRIKTLKQTSSFFTLFQKGMGNMAFNAIHHFTQHNMQQFFGQMPLVKSELDAWEAKGNTVLVLAENEERVQSLNQLFADWNIDHAVSKRDEILDEKVQILLQPLNQGFDFFDMKLVVLTEKEIFNKTKKRVPRRNNLSNAERLKNYNELKVGDYVVHANHGIGQYIGMETIEIQGVHQDYISILYRDDAKLFIPVTQLNLVSKYTSSDGKPPKINKMNDTRWAKTKAKVSKQVEDIADDLIKLYAEREGRVGFSFSPDSEYQQEFENAFSYVETDDQLRSNEEIKRDMERKRPMDRLLVGDVGFGKTEVALRAAFKAVSDGKQVAFLVPTTILAQQHFETIQERFEGFPVNVGLLSRFRSRKDQNQTIEALKRNQVDIIVGTHRLLSQDIEFSDLGLLIVDEEQRFGVKHKERLKQLKTQVDVLTLTATPIPRTLHMSMMGVRDLSVIETPPKNRFPVQTYVMEQNYGAVRDAILREIARNGQVFYLYNRVESIERKVSELEELIPEANIGYAHGQMSEVQLENVLYDFIDGQYDVLVTTTIIETGVDIPNANTIFVENSDYMGLSTLYQLRGRVGRSNRVAYAYFMYQAEKVLSEVSEKRLQALKDFTELGSGFKIAMRDLSIRGAGNLLGSQQHGFIDSVGFEMYSQLLEEAVARKQGKQKAEAKTEVEISLSIDAYLPKTYIADERQKIEIYKRIRQFEKDDEYMELQSELIDRFGDFPSEVGNLLLIGKIKYDGEKALVEKIQKNSIRGVDELKVTLSPKANEVYKAEQYFEALSLTKLRAKIEDTDGKMAITLLLNREIKVEEWLKELSNLIEGLRRVKAGEKLNG